MPLIPQSHHPTRNHKIFCWLHFAAVRRSLTTKNRKTNKRSRQCRSINIGSTIESLTYREVHSSAIIFAQLSSRSVRTGRKRIDNFNWHLQTGRACCEARQTSVICLMEQDARCTSSVTRPLIPDRSWLGHPMSICVVLLRWLRKKSIPSH